jgi:hypothetical protein
MCQIQSFADLHYGTPAPICLPDSVKAPHTWPLHCQTQLLAETPRTPTPLLSSLNYDEGAARGHCDAKPSRL